MRGLRIHLAQWVVAVICGLNFVLARLAIPQPFSPLLLMTLRSLAGGLLLITLHQIFIKEKLQSRTDLIRLAACSLFGVVSNQFLFFQALTLTHPVNASILNTLSPVLVLVLSAIFLAERLSWPKLLGIGLSFWGAFQILGGQNVHFGQDTLAGDLIILLNAASYACFLVLLKPLSGKYHPLTIARWTFTLGIPVMLLLCGPQLWQTDYSMVPSTAWWVLAFNSLGSIVIVYWLNGMTVRSANPLMVGIYMYLQPVFAALAAAWLGYKALGASTWLGALLIFSGVLVISLASKLSSEKEGFSQRFIRLGDWVRCIFLHPRVTFRSLRGRIGKNS